MPPKVLLISVCGSAPRTSRALSIEAERVFAGFEGVTRVDLGDRRLPRFRERLDRRWPRLSARLPAAATLPGRERFDLVVVHGMLVGDLGRCVPLRRLLDRADRAAFWVHELWARAIPTEHRGHLDWLRRFDRVYVGAAGSATPLEAALGKPVRPMLHPVDTLARVKPDPAPKQAIDLQWYGARIDATHQALLELADRRDLFYLYDTVRPDHPYDLDVHRRAMVRLAHRTRLMVVNPAKAAIPAHRGDQTGEVGYRYVESAAAGCVMIGGEPDTDLWRGFFGWPGACTHLPVGSTDVAGPVMELREDEPRRRALSRRNQAQALRTMDAAHRWRDVMHDFDLDPPPGVEARIADLRRRADAIEAG